MKTGTFVPIKFGGNINSGSPADAQMVLNHISAVVHQEKKIPIIVFSAVAKGTKKLREIYQSIISLPKEADLKEVRELLRGFILRHLDLLENIKLSFDDPELPRDVIFTGREEARKAANKLCLEVDDCAITLFENLRSVGNEKADTDKRFLAKFESFGERAATEILMIPLLKHFNYTVVHLRAEQFMSAKYSDDMNHAEAEIDEVVSTGLIVDRLEMDTMHFADSTRRIDPKMPPVYVIEGFIGSTNPPRGAKLRTVTFGTDASDLTTMVVAHAVHVLESIPEKGAFGRLEQLADRVLEGNDVLPVAVLVKELDPERPLISKTLEDLRAELKSTGSTLVGEQALEYAIKHGVPLRIREAGSYGGGRLFLPEEVPVGLRHQWV